METKGSSAIPPRAKGPGLYPACAGRSSLKRAAAGAGTDTSPQEPDANATIRIHTLWACMKTASVRSTGILPVSRPDVHRDLALASIRVPRPGWPWDPPTGRQAHGRSCPCYVCHTRSERPRRPGLAGGGICPGGESIFRANPTTHTPWPAASGERTIRCEPGNILQIKWPRPNHPATSLPPARPGRTMNPIESGSWVP